MPNRRADEPSELAQQLEERVRTAEHEVGGRAELRRTLGGRDGDPDGDVEAVEGAERVEVGRVVTRVERTPQPARRQQPAHRGALVRVDGRPDLEHLAPEA